MEKICRSCLIGEKQMKNIFLDDEGRLVQMIKDCTSIHVSSNDGLPDTLCAECEEKLQSAFDFRQFFKNNDQALRAHLNLVTVKTDQEDEDNEGSLEDLDNDDCDNDAFDQSLQESDEDEGQAKYKCAKCTKVFMSANYLNMHEQNKHNEASNDDPDYDPMGLFPKVTRYQCSHCEMKFARQHLLLKHQREAHLEVSMHETDKDNIKTEDTDGHEPVHESDVVDDDIEVDEQCEQELEEGETIYENLDGRKEYICEFCNKVLTTDSGLKIHMRRHTGKNLYQCNHCDKTFTKCSHMKRHRKAQHGAHPSEDYIKPNTTKREMQCEFCDRKFKYKKSFTQHMHIEHGIDVDEEELIVEPIVKRRRKSAYDRKDDDSGDEPTDDDDKKSRSHICHVCNAEFTRSNHLTRHMVLHRELLVHKCDKCDEAFTSEDLLNKHAMQHIDKPYNCFACSKNFARGEHYIRHVKTHDIEANKILQCPVCPEQFQGFDALANHVKTHLASDKRHICNTCGKAFNRADNLRTHVKSHKGEKEIPKLHLCIYCGKEFNNSSNMIVHMRRHTGERPYKCKQCGKGFPRSHDLKCHERTHSGEKPYLCTLCGKCFNKSNKLLRHSRVHTGERPYVCSICGRAFTQSNDLALHMRRHTGARPYACGVCSSRFIQSGQLKAHQRSKGHWVETTPDLKGSYRVEPVVSTGESKPIRFRRTASGHKYEPPDLESLPPPEIQAQPTQQIESKVLDISVPTSTAMNVLHLDPNEAVQIETSYAHFDENSYVKVQDGMHLHIVHSNTPTSTATFHEDNTTGTESNNAFSPNDGAYECRSYS